MSAGRSRTWSSSNLAIAAACFVNCFICILASASRRDFSCNPTPKRKKNSVKPAVTRSFNDCPSEPISRSKIQNTRVERGLRRLRLFRENNYLFLRTNRSSKYTPLPSIFRELPSKGVTVGHTNNNRGKNSTFFFQKLNSKYFVSA